MPTTGKPHDSSFENQAAGALTAVRADARWTPLTAACSFPRTTVLRQHRHEFKAQWSYLDFKVFRMIRLVRSLTSRAPAFSHRDIFLPSITIQRQFDRWITSQTVRGITRSKFGGSFYATDVSTANETFFGGRFNFGAVIPLSSLIPSATLIALRAFLTAITGPVAALNTPINALQSFNLNLPIVYQQGFGTPEVKSWTYRYALFGQDMWKVRPNLTVSYGLRYSISDEPFYMPLDKNDIQPRLGFSWDPWKDGKTAIRAGLGIFSGYTIYSVPNVTKTLSGFPGDPINIVLTAPPARSVPHSTTSIERSSRRE